MVTKAKRLISTVLMTFILLSVLPLYASADTVWAETRAEQCSVLLPELELYFYPLDSSGAIVFDLNTGNTDITATLNGEELAVRYLSDVRQYGTTYMVAVNVSSEETGFGYISSIKNAMKYWIDTMGEKDRIILITYTDDAQVLLDGSETRLAAVAGLNAITTDTAEPDPATAIRLAIKLRQELDGTYPDRAVLVMFDDGSFLEGMNYEEDVLLDSLRQAELPLYGICHDAKMHDSFASAAAVTGGTASFTNGYYCEEESKQMHSYLDGCYVLGLGAADNKLEPASRELKVSFSSNGAEQSIVRSVRVEKNIADDTAPFVEKVFSEDESHIRIEFSENVSGAEKAENFTLRSEDGTELEIVSAEYFPENFSTLLELAENLPSGKNRLELRNIKDISQEENKLEYLTDSPWLELEGPEPEEEEESSYVPIIAAAVVFAAAVAAAAIIISRKKKKEKLAREEQLLREREEKERLAKELLSKEAASAHEKISLPEQRQTDVEDRAKDFPLVLYVLLPNGIKRTSQIAIRDNYFVGRKSNNSLQINDDRMSGSHFKLSLSHGRLLVSDLGSTNGTFVNGVRIDKSRVLQSGDVILAGGTKFSVRF